jgi:hypothetical protein
VGRNELDTAPSHNRITMLMGPPRRLIGERVRSPRMTSAYPCRRKGTTSYRPVIEASPACSVVGGKTSPTHPAKRRPGPGLGPFARWPVVAIPYDQSRDGTPRFRTVMEVPRWLKTAKFGNLPKRGRRVLSPTPDSTTRARIRLHAAVLVLGDVDPPLGVAARCMDERFEREQA